MSTEPDDVRRRIYEEFVQVTQALARYAGNRRSPDVDIRVCLYDCLGILGNAALIMTFRRERVTLRLASPRGKFTSAELKSVESRLAQMESAANDGDRFAEVMDDIDVVGSWICEKVIEVHHAKRTERTELRGYAALCFRGILDDEHRSFFIELHSRSTAALIYQILQAQVSLFQSISPEVFEQYWEARRPGELPIPWQEDSVRTVTLGFDLRKSTFCLENSNRLDDFARWIDQLVQILERLARNFGAVFDKFTGDGVLVHFIVPAGSIFDPRETLARAVETAIAFQDAAEIHMNQMKKFLLRNRRNLGAGIGIALDDTRWSLDRRYSPIVVGPGVVDACRMMTNAPANSILLSNLAYQMIDPSYRQWFREVPFESKEHPLDDDVTAYQMLLSEVPGLSAKHRTMVTECCNAVYRDTAEEWSG